ncbi:helix-turn-helix transcriptional regulator [Aeromonas hydrophila]|jgi:prophage regulatory protein|uniref:helix-turn-helix transcriptional regulator n=1 Tax=Aeromonas TaxID=642 RepID=UPI002B47B883|nr:AlpA family transcriptional regulator [Aeromonas hydrophila]
MKLIKLKEVTEMTTLSKATIYRLIKQRKFPDSISVGPRAVAWRTMDILEWVQKKVDARRCAD